MNLDAGELPTETEELWSLFDLLACACGGHAGDAASMARVAAFCARSGVQLGAHPSYPDRDGFGRRTIAIEPAALRRSIAQQLDALVQIARAAGVAVCAVKPHGALYHDAARDAAIAGAVVDALAPGMMLIGPPRGALRDVAEHRGVRYLREGFADRRLRPDGSLVPRGEPDALILDPAAAARQAQALREVDTICMHADTPGALAIAQAVREAVHG
jgi:UPF0271 protein